MTKKKRPILLVILSIMILSSVLLTFLVFSSSCKDKQPSFLSYQDGNFSLTASAEINGNKYALEISRLANDNYKLTFTEPDTIKGVSLEKNGDELFLSVGGVHLPMKEETNITAKLFSLFMLKKDKLTSTKADLINGVKVNVLDFSYDFGNVSLVLSADKNIPLRITADIKGTEVVLNISEFITNNT